MSPEAARLAALLERLEAGEDPGELDGELATLIASAEAVRALDAPRPPRRLQPGRAAFIAAGVARAERRRERRIAPWWRWPTRRAAVGAALLGLALFVGSGVAVTSAAADSLPGDALYGVKLLGERVALALTWGEARVERRAEQAETRRAEARELVEIGRPETVTIEGVVEIGADGIVRVGGVPVDAEAWRAAGDPSGAWLSAGAVVRLTGVTGPGGALRPSRVLLVSAPATPIASATLVPERPPTAAPTASRTPAPTGSPTARATASATWAATVTPWWTSTPPAPTAAVIAPEPGERPARVVWEGVIEDADGGTWRVAGRSFRLGSGQVDERRGRAVVGARARVEAERRDGELWLVRLEVLGPAAPEIVEWRGPIERIEPERWVVDGRDVRLTAATEIVGEPAVGRSASVRAERRPEGSLVALRIEVEPEVEIVEFAGTLQAFDAGSWVVEGQRVRLDAATEVLGTPFVGARVEVRARREFDGTLVALRLRVLGAPPTASVVPTSEAATPTPPPTADPATATPTTRPPFPTPGTTPTPQPPPFASEAPEATPESATPAAIVVPLPVPPGPP